MYASPAIRAGRAYKGKYRLNILGKVDRQQMYTINANNIPVSMVEVNFPSSNGLWMMTDICQMIAFAKIMNPEK